MLTQIADPNPVTCKVCTGQAFLFDVVDFNKFCSHNEYYSDGLSGVPIYFRKCEECGLIFSSSFDSLDIDGFSELIYNSDYIKYDPEYLDVRPLQNASFLDSFLQSIKPYVKGLDYGGGNGLAAATLVQNGWNFLSCDPIASPVPATGDFQNFNVISAIEVFEHIPFPKNGMIDMMSYAAQDCLIIIGTQTTDSQVKSSRLDWWYAAPRNGHITLHSNASLRILFHEHGFSYHPLNSGLHIGIRGSHPYAKHLQSAVKRGAILDVMRKIKRRITRFFG